MSFAKICVLVDDTGEKKEIYEALRGQCRSIHRNDTSTLRKRSSNQPRWGRAVSDHSIRTVLQRFWHERRSLCYGCRQRCEKTRKISRYGSLRTVFSDLGVAHDWLRADLLVHVTRHLAILVWNRLLSKFTVQNVSIIWHNANRWAYSCPKKLLSAFFMETWTSLLDLLETHGQNPRFWYLDDEKFKTLLHVNGHKRVDWDRAVLW